MTKKPDRNLILPEKITKTPFNVLIANKIIQEELVRNFVRAYNKDDHTKLLIHGGSIILLCCEELCKYYSLDMEKIPSEKRTIQYLNEKGIIDEATKDYLKAVLNQRDNALKNNPVNFDFFLVDFLVFFAFIKHTSDKITTKDFIQRLKGGIAQGEVVVERTYPELINILRRGGKLTIHESKSLVNCIYHELESFTRLHTKVKGITDLKEVIDLAQSQGVISMSQTDLFQDFRYKRNLMIHKGKKGPRPDLLLRVNEALRELLN